MNVLFLTNNGDRASTTVPTRGWIKALHGRGLRPVIASPILGEFTEWAKREFDAPVYQSKLPMPSKIAPMEFAKALWHLRRIVRRHRIQIVHCNEQDCCPLGSYVARSTNVPYVVSVHFTMAREYCTWAFGGRRCPDRLVFISQGNLDACRDGVTGVIPEDRWRLLYNGLDLIEYRPDAARRASFRARYELDHCIAVGVACALRPRKQLEHLFAAVARADNDAIRVIVAGDCMPGDEEYATDLLKQGKNLLGDRLVVLGYLNELRDFYNGLDIYVNTSLEEACSISVIESLACGCPLLGYPSKSVDEQVLPDGGEIVAQDDVERLGARLAAWSTDSSFLTRGRILARRQAEALFDIRKLADQLWDEYQLLIQGNRTAMRLAGQL